MAYINSLKDLVLDHVFGSVDYTPLTTWYIGLSTTTPTDAGTNITEPASGAYARVSQTNNQTNFPDATNGVKNNGSVITFPKATASWGTVTHFVMYDAATVGNAFAWGALTASKTIDTDDTPSFAIGDITITSATA
ncbi:MAG: hypothetical protein GY841_13590 [FCB group bacterium]|nr:hypothetical protein [FCB group bacterium]